jgi:AcrR family transcriptional regulator
MTSIRHTDDAVLDAVRACVLAVGVRRTTLTEVARRAGVSRMTLYRRYPDVDALVRDLMTREFGALLQDARDAAVQSGPAPHTRARMVTLAVAAVRGFRANALFRRVLDVDPELLLPYVTDRLGSTQAATAEFLIRDIRAGQDDGSVRDGEARALAYGALLVLQPFVYSARVVADVLDDDALDRELARLLDRYLAP